jgi:hypothetical protein
MKEIVLKNGKTIRTPWLRVEEAAAYCGVVRSTFEERCKDLPHGGSRKIRLYHVKILDAWLKGDLDVSFDAEREKKERVRRPRRQGRVVDLTMVHPITGKLYPTKEF